MQVAIGDRAPFIAGAAADGRLYSLDVQAGRPAMLIALGGLEPDAAKAIMDRVAAATPAIAAAGGDIVPLAPVGAAFAGVRALAMDPDHRIVYAAEAGGLDSGRIDGHPSAAILDRAGRIVELKPVDEAVDLAALFAAAGARIASEPGRLCAASAPVLIVPNLASPQFCRAVIDHFEASPHATGTMASYVDGEARNRIDENKKLRRDIELAAGSPLHGAVMELIATRLAPEIKRAFQKDITFADRILVARYDDTGGYFRRHRDNVAAQTAFREFALSLNLNTSDYEGGELLFPEFSDNRYSPPAGSAIIFSASLLHEAAPVTRGRRYVLLSFPVRSHSVCPGRVNEAARA